MHRPKHPDSNDEEGVVQGETMPEGGRSKRQRREHDTRVTSNTQFALARAVTNQQNQVALARETSSLGFPTHNQNPLLTHDSPLGQLGGFGVPRLPGTLTSPSIGGLGVSSLTNRVATLSGSAAIELERQRLLSQLASNDSAILQIMAVRQGQNNIGAAGSATLPIGFSGTVQDSVEPGVTDDARATQLILRSLRQQQPLPCGLDFCSRLATTFTAAPSGYQAASLLHPRASGAATAGILNSLLSPGSPPGLPSSQQPASQLPLGIDTRTLLGLRNDTDTGRLLGQHDLGQGTPSARHKGLPALLAQPDDALKLSGHQVLLRHQIEAFEATEEECSTHTRGRNKPIRLGQVGIRCRHCAHMPVNQRQKGSTYFPASTMGLYQAAQNMSTTHLQCGLCTEMPENIKHEFNRLMSTKVASSGAGRPYWANSAKQLGLVDTEDSGIRLLSSL